jgi:hypothetical protein
MHLAHFDDYIVNLHKDLNEVYAKQGMIVNTLREVTREAKPL